MARMNWIWIPGFILAILAILAIHVRQKYLS